MSELSPTILISRPLAAAERFAAALQGAGIDAPVVISPLMKVEPTDAGVPLAGVSGVIFTSANGVAFAPEGNLPAWCVGEATAEAARAKGWHAIAAGGDAEALVERVLADKRAGKVFGPLLHFRGAFARGDIAKRLCAAEVETGEAVVYEQRLVPLTQAAKSLLLRENPVIVPLFSPRTAAQFSKEAALLTTTSHVFVAAMSAAVAEALSENLTQDVVVAEKSDVNSMIDAVSRLLAAAVHVEERSRLT
ncbi:uroporphyrinogen-III synthase [Shimia isoporae]|uniref:Uroporphyrinogen-III synthase n=1 Tax=Shimia isoporae TaxID=647720 RepID=A0A4R1N155_9RHOB|nr:uroporphyrinogen-III synthase [Shimia isoporae]TCK99767.1 uroporphyrinogen-III synthase [Shimia isoporae]